MLDVFMGNTAAYLLVMVRMAGMIAFNPMLSRRNVPLTVRTGLIVMLTLLIVPTLSGQTVVFAGTLDLLVTMIMELALGLVCGFVFQIFYYMLFFAGDLMDVQFGLSMAKVFDPGTNIQMSVSGNLLNLLFVLYIFATDSHLLLIRIFAASYEIIPLGGAAIGAEAASYVMELFASAFSLAVRLAAPFIAAEFILEMSMGILMKFIPQIHVFVINIQFKMLLGIGLLLVMASPISAFTDNFMRLMFEHIQNVLFTMAGSQA